jgi:ABC-2 type transport system permease protein
MLDSIKYHISVAAFFVKLAVQRQLEFPSFLVCYIIGNPLNCLASLWILNVVTGRFNALNGWTFSQITFLYGLGLVSHGIMIILFIQTWNIENMVIRGNFDRLLLRPMNVFFQLIVSYINLIGITDLVPGIIIFLYGCKMVAFQCTLINIFKLLMVLIGAVMIRGAFFTITGSIAFWTKSSRYLIATNLNLFERTTMYPLSIYPIVIQIIFTFMLPFGFISFYPACDFLGKNNGFSLPVGLALWTPLIGLILSVLAGKLFKSGLKIYESAGS